MVDMKKIAIWGDSVLKGVVLEEGKDRYSLLKDSSIELIKREYNLMIKNNSNEHAFIIRWIFNHLKYVNCIILKIFRLRTKEVTSVKVLWRNQFVEEATWEVEEDMKKRYPHLFESRYIPDQGTNSLLSTL